MIIDDSANVGKISIINIVSSLVRSQLHLSIQLQNQFESGNLFYIKQLSVESQLKDAVQLHYLLNLSAFNKYYQFFCKFIHVYDVRYYIYSNGQNKFIKWAQKFLPLKYFSMIRINNQFSNIFNNKNYYNHMLKYNEENFNYPIEDLQEVKSQYTHLYQNLQPKVEINIDLLSERFAINSISFDPKAKHQLFQFEVQKVFQSYSFFKIYVNIGQFSLNVNAIKHQSLGIIREQPKRIGNFGQIFFTKQQEKQICIKSFRFRNEANFQQIFILAIKQWSILKIASVLECAPFIQKYFGFDILIFDQSIQFACEKGKKVSELSPFQQLQLKEALSLMHGLKLIHYDVKPENIVFSQHFSKHVFIDFGFSDILKEAIGHKTLVQFRGTPNYSSPEVLAIMNQSQDFVDLYYNDAFGLNLVLLQWRQKEIILFEDDSEDGFSVSGFESQYSSLNQQDYLMLIFQYHYLCRNQMKARQILKRLLSFRQEILMKVFHFIKKLVKQHFISSIFNEDLKAFANRIDYAQIKDILKISQQRLYLKQFHQRQTQDQQAIMTNYEPVSFNGQMVSSPNCKHFSKIIQEVQQFEDKTVDCYLAISFQLIRFDAKIIDFGEKTKLVAKLLLLLNKFMDQNGIILLNQNTILHIDESAKDKIDNIRLFMALLMELSLSTKSKWAKAHIIDIFLQMLLLDSDICSYISRILSFIKQHYQGMQQQMLAAAQLTLVGQYLEMMQTSHFQSRGQLQELIKAQITIKLDLFKQNIPHFNHLQATSFQTILDIIALSNQQFSLDLIHKAINLLRNINNSKVRRTLLFQLFERSISCEDYLQNNKNLYDIIDHETRTQIRKLDFFIYAKITLKLLHMTRSTKDIQQFCKEISVMIDCKQIEDKIKMNVMREFNQPNRIGDKVKKLIKTYPSTIIDDPTFDFQLYQTLYIIISLKQNKSSNLDYMLEDLLQLHQIYNAFSAKKCKDPLSHANYSLLQYYRVQIQYYFYTISQCSQAIFSNNLEFARVQNMLSMNSNDIDPIIQLNCLLKWRIYESKQFLIEEKHQLYIKSICDLADLYQQMKMDYLTLEILKGLFIFCQNMNMEPVLLHVTKEIFSYCVKNELICFYMQQVNNYYCQASLLILSVYQEEQLFDMLIRITLYLSKHPIEGYIFAILNTLNSIVTVNSPILSVLCNRLNSILQYGMQESQYLIILYIYALSGISQQAKMEKLCRIIASNFDKLNKIALKLLLERYYTAVLSILVPTKLEKWMSIFRTGKSYLKELTFIQIWKENRKMKIKSLKVTDKRIVRKLRLKIKKY